MKPISPKTRQELIEAVASIRAIYTPYPRLNLVKRKILNLMMRPSKKSEGAVFSLIGESRSGKTHLLRVLEHEFPRVKQGIQLADGNFVDSVPILVVRIPDASVKGVTEAIYERLTGRHPNTVLGPRYNRLRVTKEIIRIAKESGLKLLILDEAHQSIDDKTDRVAGEVAVLIKDFSNDATFAQLIVGTKNTDRLVSAKDELKTRAHKNLSLPAFKRTQGDLDVWYEILQEIDAVLELKVFGRSSNLDRPDMAEALMTAANGVIGNMATLIENAAYEAVEDMLDGETTGVTWRHLESTFSEWGPGQNRPNPFSAGSRPPSDGSAILSENAAKIEEELDKARGSETIMSGAKGHVRRGNRDAMFLT